MNRSSSLWLALLLAFAAGSAVCQEPAAQTPPPPCASEQYRQFDFWLGDWEVADADGNRQGTNTIESILGGCVLRESWQGTGSQGYSHNIYDRTTGRWHQTWVDAGGTLLQVDGGLVDGAMVLEGTGIARGGATVHHRISWTPLDDGRVRQHWQTSSDGDSWSDAFLGFYTRRTDS